MVVVFNDEICQKTTRETLSESCDIRIFGDSDIKASDTDIRAYNLLDYDDYTMIMI